MPSVSANGGELHHNQMQARRRSVYLTGSEDAPPYAALEVYGVQYNGTLKVRKPSRDDIAAQYVIFNHNATLKAETYGIGTKTLPIIAAYDNTIAIANRENLGTKADSWKLHRGYEGFIAIGQVLQDDTLVTVLPYTRCRTTTPGVYSGSSGSRPRFYCCKCARFTCEGPPGTVFPSAMEITITSGVMGTRTICMDVDPFDAVTGPYGCTKVKEFSNSIRAGYAGSYLGTYYDDTYFLNRCNSMVVESGIGYFDEFVSAELGCCDTTLEVAAACQFENQNIDTSYWIVNVTWQKLIGGVIYLFHISMPVTPVTCSPLSFTTTNTLVCDAEPPGFVSYCGDTDEGFASTRNDELVGDSVQIDLDETTGPCP